MLSFQSLRVQIKVEALVEYATAGLQAKKLEVLVYPLIPSIAKIDKGEGFFIQIIRCFVQGFSCTEAKLKRIGKI
jgi:hypothetical protein